ncbi:hypothetical protein TYRP_005876 [Tyrophagus putrescentiae]|nr:hypothetical protein TYRP_005876 [Tyrophagus putrescentiae]
MLSKIINAGSSYSIDRVKFGIPLESVCESAHNDIPGPLLVMILKLNKEAPYKKDVFRAPGHQASMKKLIHFLQNGRLVNIDNYSVYTIASVLKKFLRKLPSGVFGVDREQRLFEVIGWADVEEKRLEIHRILLSLPVVTQHLLVLLFGTFRAIANSSESSATGMTSEAISISVAPSFFQSCVSDGKQFAKIEDVQRFKIASSIMKFMIDNFGIYNLFGRDNYEYYARISGRVLKVEENWIFAFKYPPENVIPRKLSLMAEREWLICEAHKWGLPQIALSRQLKEIGSVEECQSTPTLVSREDSDVTLTRSHHQPIQSSHIEDSYARLSMSLEESFFRFSPVKTNSNSPQSIVTVLQQQHPGPSSFSDASQSQSQQQLKQQSYSNMLHAEMLKLEDLKTVNRYAESTKSLTFLPIVHERQTARMKTRSEWFLNPKESPNSSSGDSSAGNSSGSSSGTSPLSSSAANVLAASSASTSVRSQPLATTISTQQVVSNKPLIRKSSSGKEKRLIRRTSSKKDKENGGGGGGEKKVGGGGPSFTEADCTRESVRQMNVTFTYKPRH